MSSQTAGDQCPYDNIFSVDAAERAADEAEEALIEQSVRLGCLPCDSTITAAHARAEQFKTWARAAERLAAQPNGEN